MERKCDGMEYCSRIVKTFRIFMGKRKKIDYEIVSLFRTVTVCGTYYSCMIVNVFGIFIEKGIVNYCWIEKVSGTVVVIRI